ncbi:MAG: tetratricopeptide repeat protein [Planctomycetaceae bacterium]
MSSTAPAPKPRSPRRRKRVAAVVGLAVVLPGLIWLAGRTWYFAVDPPRGDVTGAARELTAAIDKARDEVQSHPRSAEHWGKLGDVFLANNFHVEAAECYGRAAELDSKNNPWLYLQAVAVEYFDLNRSLELFQRAVSQKESRPFQSVRYGLASERAGRLDEARAAWTHVIETDPHNIDAHLGLGRIALGRQELDAAAEHFHAVERADSRYREAHVALIQIANRLQDREAVKRHRAQLADCYREAPRPLDPLLAKVQRKWVSLRFVNLLAEADRREAEGNLPGFVAACRELIELDPDNPQPRVRMGIALARMRDVPRAIEVFEEAARRHPQDASVHYNFGVVLSQTGQWDAAAESFRQAIVYKPDDAESYFGLGVCLDQLGQKDDAVGAFEQAVASRPDHFPAHHKLGEILVSLRKTAEAIDHFQIALRLRPDDGNVREALDQLQQPTASQPAEDE